MNTKRIFFWSVFLIVLALIVWGLAVAMDKAAPGQGYGTPSPVTPADHVEGPADAKVTLIEFGDFECPACAEYATMVERLFSDEATGTLRIAFRHFPLPQHLNSTIAAQASEAAAMQGRFWDMYRLLYAGQDSWVNLSDAGARQAFAGYAGALGLDAARFAADIDSDVARQAVQADLAESESIGLDHTPTFFLNGKVIDNPQNYEAFKAIIDAAAR